MKHCVLYSVHLNNAQHRLIQGYPWALSTHTDHALQNMKRQIIPTPIYHRIQSDIVRGCATQLQAMSETLTFYCPVTCVYIFISFPPYTVRSFREHSSGRAVPNSPHTPTAESNIICHDVEKYIYLFIYFVRGLPFI